MLVKDPLHSVGSDGCVMLCDGGMSLPLVWSAEWECRSARLIGLGSDLTSFVARFDTVGESYGSGLP